MALLTAVVPSLLLVTSLVLAGYSGTSTAASATLTEAQVKAGLLYNFLSFVEWPVDVAGPSTPIVIGVVGKDPVSVALREVNGQMVQSRRVETREIEGERDARQCHILFVPGNSGRDVTALLAALRDAPVLTVGEHEHFTRVGGVIRIYPERSRLRLEIDIGRAERVGLRISSRLLGLSRVVRDGHAVVR